MGERHPPHAAYEEPSGASHWNCGYRNFSLQRASLVVNCQLVLT